MWTVFGLIDLLIWWPIFLGGVLLLTAKRECWVNQLRYVPLAGSLLLLALLLYCWWSFNPALGMQMVKSVPWIEQLGVQYSLGMDGIALLMLLLTGLMNVIVLLAAHNQVGHEKFAAYAGLFLLMQGLMNGVFLALDALLFYLFFEAMMIPMFMIIGLWGGAGRIYATFKFIMYTFVGSLFLLIAILYLAHLAGEQFGYNFDRYQITTLQNLSIPLSQQKWLFWAFLLSFAVKIPMWPVHTWLPDAHVEAPTGGSIILAAITLKMGAYGMLRFLLPCVPAACVEYANVVIVLSLLAIVYVGLVAIVQQDMKKLIAYSSIAHMGFVTLGLFLVVRMFGSEHYVANASLAVSGAVMQMVSHGFVSGALFLCVGVLYSRMHTRNIADFGGVANVLPGYAACFMVFALANVGMPGTTGFVGEFFVILASFKVNFWYAAFAALSLILGVAYTLWMYKRVVFGEVIHEGVATLHALNKSEKVALGLLVGVIVLFGVWPEPLLRISNHSIEQLVLQLPNHK